MAQRKHFTAQLIAVNSKSKMALGIAAGLILAGSVLFIFPSSHLPRPQSPPAAGTLIPKNQLVFAGYGTPEAALESALWAFQNVNHDAAVASISPKDQDFKNRIKDLKCFKSMAREETEGFQSIQILAKKMLSGDVVELKYQIVHDGQTNCLITPTEKVGSDWKINFDGADSYTTNWDNSGDIITFDAQ
jgi:hypothetical protein